MATANSSNNNKSHSEKLGASAHEAVDKATEKAEAIEEKIRENVAHSKERTDELSKAIRNYVNDRPVASLGIAFVGGLIISSLLRR